LGLATLSVLITPTSWGVNELIRLFSGASFFFTAGLALGDKKKFDRFALVFLAIIYVPLVLSLFQVAGLLPYEYWDWLDGLEVGRASGTYQHPLEIVFFLVYAVPLALYRWEQSEKRSGERIFLASFFILTAFGLTFTLHRAGWIAIAAEFVIWFASRRQIKKILLSTIAIVVLGMFFTGWLSVFFEPVTEIVTGQADFAKIEIDYVPNRLCVESKSLKFYLASFRNERAFNEAITNRILDDFLRACAPHEAIVTATFSARGGIALIVRAAFPDGANSGRNGR